MKRMFSMLFSILAVLFMLIFALTSCVPTDGLNEYKKELDDTMILVEELEDEVEVLESALKELQSQIDTICPVED